MVVCYYLLAREVRTFGNSCTVLDRNPCRTLNGFLQIFLAVFYKYLVLFFEFLLPIQMDTTKTTKHFPQ